VKFTWGQTILAGKTWKAFSWIALSRQKGIIPFRKKRERKNYEVLVPKSEP
jgi:hypothetical protein